MEFSMSDLEKAVGKNGIEEMKSIVIDKGTAFLSNQITSSFVKAGKDSTIASTTQLAAAGLGAYEIGKEAYKMGKEDIDEAYDIINDLSQKIIAQATEIVTKEATACIASYTKKHLTEIQNLPSSISSYAMSKFNEEKMSVGDIIKELTGDSDDEVKKTLEQSEKNQQKNFITKSKEKINKVSGDITKYTQIITDKIGTVTNYIQEGPDWVVDQINKQCQAGSNYINKYMDAQWQKDKEKYDKFAKAQGDSVGIKMASEYNKALKHAQKKILDKQNVKLTAAKTKAKTTILGNALMLAAKTGIL